MKSYWRLYRYHDNGSVTFVTGSYDLNVVKSRKEKLEKVNPFAQYQIHVQQHNA